MRIKIYFIAKVVLAVLLFFPFNAYAYLDPGTGNAILAALFGIAASLVFFAKNIFYSISGKKTPEVKQPLQLAFFSEGKIYWNYYKDIINELIKRKVRFIYYTLDINDPAFELLDFGNPDADLEYFQIQYAGGGNRGFAKISNIKEPVIVTTTPNIGVKEYPVKKSAHCKNLVHIFHAVSGIGGYRKHSLDNFDTAMLVGPCFEKEIRILEEKRNLKPKTLLISGLPYVDNLVERAAKLNAETNGKTVLVASTWDARGCLKTYGSGFIIDLAKNGFDVIVRPHPYSYIYEADFIKKLQDELKPYENVVFDSEIDNLKTMAKSDIMITDFSGVRFDFILAFDRPVISLETDLGDNDKYENADMGFNWDISISHSMGAYIERDEIGSIVEKVKANMGAKSPLDRSDIVANIGCSASVIADQLEGLLNNLN